MSKLDEFFGKKLEKKVEYIELIYDLIFVYLIGRNNALLHNIENGFFSISTFLLYLISTLVILQVWYFSTLFINRYGTSSVRDYICLFINMYLLYYLADGTRSDWELGYFTRYNVAWGLILLNLAAQYWFVLRCSGKPPWEERHLKYHMRLLLIQSAIVFCGIPIYALTSVPLSWLTLLFGFAAAVFTVRIDALVPVNAEHLTERVMLFVVFTFGETIVSLAAYFTNSFSFNTVYFSLMAFLIVTGLFLSYGYLYDHVIDRERDNIEMSYMLLHIVLIIALNNITVAMEFMREAEVSEIAKNAFIVVSFLIYYLFLFFIGHYARAGCKAGRKFFIKLAVISAVFVVLMAFLYKNSWCSITISALYVYSMFAIIVQRWRKSGLKAADC